MRPLYAIDICNTLADVNRVLQQALGPRSDASQYSFPGATREFFENNSWVFSRAPVLPGAVKGVYELASVGSILYLTARPEWAREITRVWLTKNGFPPGEIICTDSKADVVRQFNVTLAVDDAPHEIEALASFCPVMVYAQSYNTGYTARFRWAC